MMFGSRTIETYSTSHLLVQIAGRKLGQNLDEHTYMLTITSLSYVVAQGLTTRPCEFCLDVVCAFRRKKSYVFYFPFELKDIFIFLLNSDVGTYVAMSGLDTS